MEKQTQGILIVISALVLGSAALFLVGDCSGRMPDYLGGACVQYAYREDGVLLGATAAALLIVGFLSLLAGDGLGLIIRGHPFPPGHGGQAAFGPAYCYACGQPLAWIGTVGRWYCSRCAQYR